MNFKIIYSILIFTIIFNCCSISAQQRCALESSENTRSKNLAYLRSKSVFESKVNSFLRNSMNTIGTRQEDNPLIRIPVVVHVIHNVKSNVIGGIDNPNISDEQIHEQIAILNEDYRKMIGTNGYNTHPVGADMNIEFYLASTDPNGIPTTGITRHYNAQNGWDFRTEGSKIAKIVQWNTERYLNIYTLISSNEFIGYSSLPYDSNIDGLDANSDNLKYLEEFDGVLIRYNSFGKCCGNIYNIGRSATHEIGHWLGLLHPNGDTVCGTDYCDDTPPIEALNSTNDISCKEKASNCTGIVTKNQIENYMDYSPDRCMNMFTYDQKKRVRAVFEVSPKRKALLNSLVKISDTPSLVVTPLDNPISTTCLVKVSFTGIQNLIFTLFDMQGRLVYETRLQNQISGNYIQTISTLKNGYYILKVQSNEEVQTTKIQILR